MAIKSSAIDCARCVDDPRYHIFCPTPSELGDPDLKKNQIIIYAGKAPLSTVDFLLAFNPSVQVHRLPVRIRLAPR